MHFEVGGTWSGCGSALEAPHRDRHRRATARRRPGTSASAGSRSPSLGARRL